MKTIQRWEAADIDFKDLTQSFIATGILMAMLGFKKKDGETEDHMLRRVVADFLNTASDFKVTIAPSIPDVFIGG